MEPIDLQMISAIALVNQIFACSFKIACGLLIALLVPVIAVDLMVVKLDPSTNASQFLFQLLILSR